MPGQGDKRKLSDDEDEEQAFSDDDDYQIIEGIRIPPPTKPSLTFDPDGPRLMITKIHNNFFKSYADDQVLGPFHKCFNSIIGPNGSGKSNVIDSMLFVFGYRSTRMRSKKVSTLLHNSDKYRNIQSCYVAVHFALIVDKGRDEYDVVENSEFVVCRTANKDGSSYYTLDGRRVQFKEVAKVLKKYGIDLVYDRFLILQGEVEQIAMMNCKAQNENEVGMLEYLEDIIGTTGYKKPLQLVNERIEYITSIKSEKMNRINLLKNELVQLEEPMKEAVAFLKTENTVVQSKNFLYQKEIYNIENKFEDISKEKEGVEEELRNIDEKLKNITGQKEEKNAILKQKSATYELLQKRKEGITEAFNTANNRDLKLQEKMVSTNANRKKIKQQIINENKRLEKLQNAPQKADEDIKECQDKLEQETANKVKYEEEKRVATAAVIEETKGLQEKRGALQNELIGLKKTAEEAKSAYNIAESELKLFTSSAESEKKKLEELTSEYESVKANLEEKTKLFDILSKKLQPTERSLNDALNELNGFKKKEETAMHTFSKNKKNLEEKRSLMQASASRNRVLDSLMNEKKKGNLPGLYGRLGDLGGIDQKYDVAISTACGPLDDIVVDVVQTAEAAIQFLKTHNIGRANFIPLDRQEHLREKTLTKITTPEGVPRLFDLVKVQDEKVKTAFYYALRDTLVAGDIDQGSRIAYGAQRYRVVTLKGELIELSGTMSGGGKTVSRGRMGQSVKVANVDPVEINNLEQELVKTEGMVRETRQRQADLSNQIKALQPELEQMKLDYDSYTSEIKDLKLRKPRLEKQLVHQRQKTNSTKADPVQVEKLTKTIAEKKEVYDEMAEKVDAFQQQIDAITNEMNEKNAKKVGPIDKKIKAATVTINKCTQEITRLRNSVTTSKRDLKNCEQQIANMEQKVSEMEESLKQMRDERTEIEEDAAKLLKCIEEITEQLKGDEESYADIKESVAELTAKENELKSEKIDIDHKYKTIRAKVNEFQGAIHQLKAKLSQLKLQNIPEESPVELKEYTESELEEENAGKYQKDLENAENVLKVAKPNLSIIEEYNNKRQVLVERTNDLDELNERRLKICKVFDDLKSRRKDEFMKGFNIIRMKLKEMYQMITLGGDADFELIDNYDPFHEGIQLSVRPPKKCWKHISNLSGGEKTLTSLALVFALHYYKPSPFYVMDEIDAALDFKNVSIIANYIKERTNNAQFIIISLRSEMFENADNLIGIYKTYNCTKSVTLDHRVYGESRERNGDGGENDKNGEANGENVTGSEMNGDNITGRETNGENITGSKINGGNITGRETNGESSIEASMNASNEEDMDLN
ncbi:unnamed protein product [Phyllotreta striolata]|uniref:Structural maintenance of chromosomes protein n=1 Tax=Phyllotreta striolata TaxID=444603 RepID=A0A9N9TPK3_PHYSR|nr:unnamed protein product [Phyllotreta striolata]